MPLLARFLDLFRASPLTRRIDADENVFQRKYRYFKSLLAGNNKALESMTELENLFYDDKPFGLEEFVGQCESLIGDVYDICEDLNALSGGRYPGLFDAAEKMGVSILRDLVGKRKFRQKNLILPLRLISHENADEVGGKAANLGEVFNRAGAPTPPGFAVTAWACHQFLSRDRLHERVEACFKGVDPSDTGRLMEAADEARALILAADLPPELEEALRREAGELERAIGPGGRFSVRSSATCEDSEESSFAGQFDTVLNVSAADVVQAWKRVAASAWNPRAVFYRRTKGYRDSDVIMAVLVVAMVDAKASGVLYTADPNLPAGAPAGEILVSAVWGLGVAVVDGSAPTDLFRVDKATRRIAASEVARKESLVTLKEEGGVRPRPVPEELIDAPALTDEQLLQLADYGLKLEEHYGLELDVEWVLDRSDRLCILQARPLHRSAAAQPAPGQAQPEPGPTREAERPGFEVLVRGEATASPGAACGQAYVLVSDHTLLSVPEGAILVAQQTSPAYVAVMGRVRAIVTEFGSVTGHMASVAREFHIPTLVGAPSALQAVPHGEEITVDATGRVVYRGCVEELAKERKRPNLMRGSPVYKTCQEALKKIAPLNLIDPNRPDFAPEGCKTLHDVIRFAHETGMREMFRIADDVDDEEVGLAVRVRAGLPLNILAVDLGGGLNLPEGARVAEPEHVASVPFRALLAGMRHEGVEWSGAIGLNVSGFASIMAESVFRDPEREGRMGGPNYAIISREYLNFNARLGYHFAVVDAFCGDQINDNYVTFSFKGGAADIARRTRRAGLIAAILKRLGFKVEQKGDHVRGELKKYDRARLQEKLDMVGRLLGAVRLLDMMLGDESSAQWYVDEFFKGNYSFKREG